MGDGQRSLQPICDVSIPAELELRVTTSDLTPGELTDIGLMVLSSVIMNTVFLEFFLLPKAVVKVMEDR